MSDNRNRQRSLAAMRKAVDAWNRQHSGTGARCGGVPVRYWPGVREGEGKTSVTTGDATILGGHTAGVYIAGAGFVALSHVEALADGGAQ